ncbi:MAG: hydantoinase/oxoprolinase family protein [Deltaproteobacteria bacterium]|nr:hydantoinase/oxoprolinase family protein [Deltaproteobacteria bacterium]
MSEKNQKNHAGLGLGIDVGGTFSDSVLIDMGARTVLSKAKSPTTHDNLIKGIERSVGLLDRSLFPGIRLVSLSTTLATNALVEGRKSRIAAILPGYKRSLCPEAFLKDIHLVAGGHTAEGEEAAPLDVDAVRKIIEATRDRVEAYAVSAYFSTRNPIHEHTIKELIGKLAPNLPVACGHELSVKLNARHRAITTILNAHLIPLIRSLLHSVSRVLEDYRIDAPLMVVKGDGSLYREALCRERPVETILSGPAASVVGAGFLMKNAIEDAVVIDIGGTTSDIAVLSGGAPKLNEAGVAVGPWQTHVTAVDVRTVGLGGDSHIYLDHRQEIHAGPNRVEPLCLLGERFPALITQMRHLLKMQLIDERFTPTAFWTRTERDHMSDLSARELDILKVLSEGPLNIFQLAKRLDVYPISVRDELDRLEDMALVRVAGFTPTDIFQIRGQYQPGVREFSLLAAQYLAGRAGMALDGFLLKVDETIRRKAGLQMVECLSGPPVPYASLAGTCPACHQTWRNTFWERGRLERQTKIGRFRLRLSLDVPIVGIGAPAHIMLPPLAKRMAAEARVPEHAEVANALGAIVGTIIMHDQVLIRPFPPEGFACFTSEGKSVYSTVEEALAHSREYLHKHLREQVKMAGGNGCELNLWEDRKAATLASGHEHLIEVVLRGQAVSKPRLQGKANK